MKKSIITSLALLVSTSTLAATENDNLKSKHGVGLVVSTDSFMSVGAHTAVEYNNFNVLNRVGFYGRVGHHDHGYSLGGGVNIRIGSTPIHVYTGIATSTYDREDYIYFVDGDAYYDYTNVGVDVGLKYSTDHFYSGLGLNAATQGANFNIGFTF